jgi:hypothetical protein
VKSDIYDISSIITEEWLRKNDPMYNEIDDSEYEIKCKGSLVRDLEALFLEKRKRKDEGKHIGIIIFLFCFGLIII